MQHPEAVILLVTASWCLPCRPARTLLAELQRRWGDRVLPVILDVDTADPKLDGFAVAELPTWIVLRPVGTSRDASGPHVEQLKGTSTDAGSSGRHCTGESLDETPLLLRGEWRETARRVGAAPKLEILALVGDDHGAETSRTE